MQKRADAPFLLQGNRGSNGGRGFWYQEHTTPTLTHNQREEEGKREAGDGGSTVGMSRPPPPFHDHSGEPEVRRRERSSELREREIEVRPSIDGSTGFAARCPDWWTWVRRPPKATKMRVRKLGFWTLSTTMTTANMAEVEPDSSGWTETEEIREGQATASVAYKKNGLEPE